MGGVTNLHRLSSGKCENCQDGLRLGALLPRQHFCVMAQMKVGKPAKVAIWISWATSFGLVQRGASGALEIASQGRNPDDFLCTVSLYPREATVSGGMRT